MIEFTIGLAPRTKKNSQRIIMCNGRPMIIPSKAYKQYEKESRSFMPRIASIDYPVNIQAIYYMPTRHRVDLCNLHEALHDVLVHHGVLKDDNSKIIVSTDGSRVSYDKENPRTEVIIQKVGDYNG